MLLLFVLQELRLDHFDLFLLLLFFDAQFVFLLSCHIGLNQVHVVGVAAKEHFPNVKNRSNFRDDKIRINDDRKIEMQLSDFNEDASVQVLLMVKTFDLRRERDLPENMHNEAWFRL